MLEGDQTERVSTGLDALDAVLGGLCWGENVAWQLDGVPAAPFYRAIARIDGAFDAMYWVAFTSGRIPLESGIAGLEVIDARPEGLRAQPADLLHCIRRRCDPRKRNLLLFESMEGMVRSWGGEAARHVFARCSRMLLEIGTIGYWSMSMDGVPSAIRETVESFTQCVLRVEKHSMWIVKAEGRDESAEGSLLHWQAQGHQPVLTPTGLPGRVAASLRAIRRSRGMTQHELALLGGVTSSAISQAERVERGLSLATLTRLSTALGMTIDELVRGEDSTLYRIGRRREDPRRGPSRTMTLLGGSDLAVRVDLVHLRPREASAPFERHSGQGIVAVASGLVQVHVAGETPALRHGEVLLADCSRIERWRNVGETDAALFWIVVPAPRA
jgi:transcriptional regulator with XRE-family HTH domain